MRFTSFSVAALLAVSAFAHAADKAGDPIPLSMEWHVSIDAQGHVTQLQAKSDKRVDRVAQVRDTVEQTIRGWQFIPGKVDGTPQATETTLSVSTMLLPRGADRYEIRIDDARTGADIAKLQAPRYPEDAARSFTSGLVVLRIEYDNSGKVTSVTPDKNETKAAGSLVRAASDAARKWTFQPERVGGHGVAGTTVLPICFRVVPLGTPTPNLPGCAWTPPGHHTALSQGEALALDPVARLSTDVIGHTL